MINPGSCSGEVVSDTDSNGSRFDDGEHSGEDLCNSGGESDDGTDGGGGDGGCSVSNNDKDRNLKKEIVSCILRGLILAEEMKTSIKSMESLLEYANVQSFTAKAIVHLKTVLIRLQADLGYKPRPQTCHAKS